MVMDRANSKHGPRLDDEMEREVRALLQGRPGGGRVEEFHDPEAPGQDQPETAEFPEPGLDRPGGAPLGITEPQAERRARFAGYLNRSVFPAGPARLRAAAQRAHAPDDILALLDRLPEARYPNVAAVWQALGGGIESQRW
jgi:hypothetical protein